MRATKTIGCAILLAAAGSAGAAVNGYVGAQIVNVDGSANFNTIQTFDDLSNYQEGGLTVKANNFAYQWVPPGFDGTGIYYPNGGLNEQIYITRTDGLDFSALEFQLGNGWGQDTTYFWAAAYLDGVLQGDIDMDVAPSGSVVGFSGQFDELRVASYNFSGDRDQHNTSIFQSTAMDNMRYGTIPAPGAAGLLAAAGLVGLRRRR